MPTPCKIMIMCKIMISLVGVRSSKIGEIFTNCNNLPFTNKLRNFFECLYAYKARCVAKIV